MDIHDFRAAARQSDATKRASGAAVLCAAILLPLAGIGAGLLARTGGSGEPAVPAGETTVAASLEDDLIAEGGTSGEIAAALKQQYPGALKRAQKAIENVDPETSALASQQRTYRHVTGMLLACRKEFPTSSTYETMLQRYQEKNAPVLARINARASAKTEEHMAELQELEQNIDGAGKARQMFEVAKFTAGGGASRYAANISVAMSGALAESDPEANSESCRVLVEELSVGKHNLVAPA